jgi:hypothetical protein
MSQPATAMKRALNILKVLWMALVLLVSGSDHATAQGASRQMLTLQVVELDKLNLHSPSAVSFNHQDTIIPHQFHLDWICNGEEKKITVARKGESGLLLLQTRILDATGDVNEAGTMVLLANASVDLLIGLSRSAGRCVIQYRLQVAAPGFAEAIIYTITGS